MYQFQWSEKSKAESSAILYNSKAFYEKLKIEETRISQWEEHCLECSDPLCYSICEKFKPRRDKRCRTLFNGFILMPPINTVLPYGARVKFRPWSNILSFIYPGVLGLERAAKIERANNIFSGVVKLISKIPFISNYKTRITDSLDYIRRYYLKHAKKNTNHQTKGFVLHCYSHNDKSFQLFFEVVDRKNNKTVIYRKGICIEPGENFQIIPSEEYGDDSKYINRCYVRIYPENNFEADLTIYFCSFANYCGEMIETKTNTGLLHADKVKCVVWDLDNTLWNGILIESDPDKLQLCSGVSELLTELDRRGILLSIASKNESDQAMAVLKRMGISQYFLYPKIHWEPKSTSIQEIADHLNIGIDSLAFIDDSVFERNEVQKTHPNVRIYTEKEIPVLLDKPEFLVEITDESGKRREMYRTDMDRKVLLKSYKHDYITFLQDCDLEISLFQPIEQDDIKRCYELVQRTNQLNLSGNRYTFDEFLSLLNEPGFKCISFSCSDKFGQYGIIGFTRYIAEAEKLVFDELAISCRTAGKFVESAFFEAIRRIVEENENLDIEMILKITKKNLLLRNELIKIGFVSEEIDNTQSKYRIIGNRNLLNFDIVKATYLDNNIPKTKKDYIYEHNMDNICV